ncbi:hypothetical protein ACFWZ7_14425 [Nocardiopsis alba]|uniref:hypothetical protein n=1 Tax=Nocardiopsis alba TaxID=53437 RepID=UPI003671239D
MLRNALDLLLLVAAAALVVTGIVTYPDINAGVLAGLVVAAALLLAPIGGRSREAVNA